MTHDCVAATCGEIFERSLAQIIALDVLRSVQGLPVDRRLDQATSNLHKRLLHEMLDFKDRLAKQVESLLTEAKREVEAIV